MAGGNKGSGFKIRYIFIFLLAAFAVVYLFNTVGALIMYSIDEAANHSGRDEMIMEAVKKASRTQKTVAIDYSHVVKVNRDGTVKCFELNTNDDYKLKDVSPMVPNPLETWEDITEICLNQGDVLGLRSDGTVVFGSLTGYSDHDYQDRDLVSQWSGIIDIGLSDYNSYGLKNDGTVVSAGKKEDDSTVLNKNNIIGISANDFDECYGIQSDGSLTNYSRWDFYKFAHWRNLAHIDFTHSRDLCGIRNDGTVKINEQMNGEYVGKKTKAKDWKNIVCVGSCDPFILGVTDSGEVLSAQCDETKTYGACDVSGWKDIHAVVTDELGRLTIGKHYDGTYEAAADDEFFAYSLARQLNE